MARTPAETMPSPDDGQQMDRSNDPAETAAMDAAGPAVAMSSTRQRLTGSAMGVGSVEYDDPGAYEIGMPRDVQDEPVTDDPPPPSAER